MKNLRHLSLVFAGLCAALLHLAVPSARAATADANPPGKLTYQGFLTDQNGAPLGNTSPINTNIFFRIYTASTGGTLKWAEVQTVTIDKGHFSVLLGEGGTEAANPGVFNANLTGVFTGNDASDRFMEIWLGPSTVALTQIAPRLQFQPAPYAMLASGARQLIDSAGNAVMTATGGAATFTGNVTASSFTGNGANLTALSPANIASGTVGNALTLNNVGNSFTGNGASLTTLNGANISAGTIANTAISATAAIADTKLATISTAGKVADSALSANIPLKDTANTFARGLQVSVPNSSLTPLLSLSVPDISWGTEAKHDDFRYIKTSSGATDRFKQFNVGAGGVSIGYDNVPAYNAGQNDALYVNGNVGIGTTAPTVPLEVATSVNHTYVLNAYLAGSGAFDVSNDPSRTNLVSIKASGIIVGQEVHVTSDARIKRLTGRTTGAAALDSIRQLQVTDYQYVDTIGSGRGIQRGFIAQEVEKVIPGAVSRGPGTVPDVFALAVATRYDSGTKSLTVALAKPHGLSPNDLVSLVFADKQGDFKVTAVPSATEFVVQADSQPAKVFVYGRRVDDFRTVNYDRIFTTGISAIQELARQNEELQKRVARLESLEQKLTRMDALERKLADLEKLVARAGEPRQEVRPSAQAPVSEVKAGASR